MWHGGCIVPLTQMSGESPFLQYQLNFLHLRLTFQLLFALNVPLNLKSIVLYFLFTKNTIKTFIVHVLNIDVPGVNIKLGMLWVMYRYML